ncbi:MAG: 2-isopropylmalate synthase [Spirochaetaceae bacterium]|nr:2-isopropylmalate synthase [Spirochaetaceae bacterium]
MRRITIFDTTLRDGDQAFSFGADEKIALALALAEAGVDVIETGFPLSGRIDFAACGTIARELQNFKASPDSPPLTAVMCRGRPGDIAESAKVFTGGIPGILHISLPVSKIHIEAKLGKTQTEVIALAREAVSFAAGLALRVELGAEDAFRADRGFLLEYCLAAIDAGAHTVNIADTVGAAAPDGTRELVAFLCSRIPDVNHGENRAVLSIHCHNDLGLACANTLAALEAGCGQAEVSVCGLGERAGNAALEEVAANIELRSHESGLSTRLLPERFPKLLDMAAVAAGGAFSPMKPLRGWNTRSNGSGIHQQGLSRNTETYSLAGLKRWAAVPERISLSRHSGRSGTVLFAERYCGFRLDEETSALITETIKGREAVTGITEFLCILADIGKLPYEFPRPLIRRSFSALFTVPVNRAAPEAIRVNAVVAKYGGGETGRTVSGDGENEAGAVSQAVESLCGLQFTFSRTALNGYGGRLRLYTEIATPSGRTYALERLGVSTAELLFLCGLDAVNAEAARAAS